MIADPGRISRPRSSRVAPCSSAMLTRSAKYAFAKSSVATGSAVSGEMSPERTNSRSGGAVTKPRLARSRWLCSTSDGLRHARARPRNPATTRIRTQDYEYVAGSGDLDECNGRVGVTPEFPNGTYHYYITDTFPFIQRCVKGTL